jgi:hypothetical protein
MIKIHITTTSSFLLYGCETWSLTLREVENTVVRRIYGYMREEVTGE